MRRCLLLSLIGIILQLTSISSYAGCLVKLKNGREISGEHYRVEGSRILLYLDSGTVRIPKDDVQSVLVVKTEIIEDKKEEPREENKNIALSLKGKSKEGVAIAKQEIATYIKRKAEIGERLQEAKKAYFNALEKSEKETARERMISISKELFSLQEEVTTRSNGIVPEWLNGN